MGFAVLHIEKGKGTGNGLGNHIDRKVNVPNADKTKEHLNFYLRLDENKEMLKFVKTPSKEDLNARINARIKQGYRGKNKIRKDAVTHLKLALTGSHKDMKDIEQKGKIKDWAIDNFIFLSHKYGEDNIVEFSVHRDERTPHIHAVIVPLTKDGRLSAKEIMGDSRQLSKLQGQYGAYMNEKYNLKRGVKGSKATHDSIKEYYARVNQSMRNFIPLKDQSQGVQGLELSKPPRIGLDKWTQRANKAISDTIEENVKVMTQNSLKSLKNMHTLKIQADEKARRLKKENAQLRGELMQIYKEQNQAQNKEHNHNRGLKI